GYRPLRPFYQRARSPPNGGIPSGIRGDERVEERAVPAVDLRVRRKRNPAAAEDVALDLVLPFGGRRSRPRPPHHLVPLPPPRPGAPPPASRAASRLRAPGRPPPRARSPRAAPGRPPRPRSRPAPAARRARPRRTQARPGGRRRAAVRRRSAAPRELHRRRL